MTAGPRLPGRNPGGQGSARNATWLAMFGLVAVTAGLFGLMAMVMPQMAIVILLAGAFGLVFCAHYLVWGYWLDRSRAKAGDSEGPIEFWKQAPPQSGPVEYDDSAE
jgi:hypothetical protein